MSISGSCACQSVKFELLPPLRDVITCHCKQCRKMTGHFWAATAVAKQNLKFLKEEGLTWFQSSKGVRRGFCKICGSNLFYDREGRDFVAVSPGAIDAEIDLKTTEHIFVDEKGTYYDLSDALPQSGGWSKTWAETDAKDFRSGDRS